MYWVVFVLMQMVCGALTSEEMFHRRDTSQDGVIHITSHEFDDFFNGVKDYYLITLFTTLNLKFGCTACEKFDPVYQLISASILQDHGHKPIFFTIADFDDNVQNFQLLQLNTVPHVWIYPPTDNQQTDVKSDHFIYQIPETINDLQDLALHFGDFLSTILHINIIIQTPFEFEKFIKNFLMYLALFIIIKKRGRKILDKFKTFHFYFILSTVLIFLSTSGYQFCIQRNVPFIAKDHDDNIMYFSGGTQYQFGLEMVNITSIYTILTMLMILLISFIPMLRNKNLQTVLTLMAVVLLFVVVNLLNSVFLIKDPSYPFTFWKLF